MSTNNAQALWQIRSGPGGDAIIWFAPYVSNARDALKKWHKLSWLKQEDKEARAAPLICVVDDCWSFATKLLCSGELAGIVPKELWVICNVEVRPGDQLHVNTVCPMCEKHARRFRRTAQERIFRLEERMDAIQKALKELEYGQWT